MSSALKQKSFENNIKLNLSLLKGLKLFSTMLEHQKIVLNGVKNDKRLFKKELIKSLAWLNAHEQTQLRKWVRKHFYHLHAEIIKDVLYPKYEQAS